MDETPGFRHFAGAYLHQDWRHDYRDEWEALADFIATAPERAALVPHEVGQVLRKVESEDGLEEFVHGQGATYVANPDRGGYASWLAQVARTVEAMSVPPGEEVHAPQLETLVASYLHEDFVEVHGDVWGAVDAFVRDGPDDAPSLVRDIERLLQRLPDEAAVERCLDSWGCAYWADPAAGGYRSWLSEVARRVAEGSS